MDDFRLSDFKAIADIRPGRINLSWVWGGPEPMPPFTLIRQIRAYSQSDKEGQDVLFGEVSHEDNWKYLEKSYYLNSKADDGCRDLKVEMTCYYPTAESREPRKITMKFTKVSYADPASVERMVKIENIVRLQRREVVEPEGYTNKILSVFQDDGEGEQRVGDIVIRHEERRGNSPPALDFEWKPKIGYSVKVRFNLVVKLGQKQDQRTEQWQYDIEDTGLPPEVYHYYALFIKKSKMVWKACAMPTDGYGFGEHLYNLVPAVHKLYDQAPDEQPGDGQLHQFLEIFGVALDQVRSSAEGLRNRIDTCHAPAFRLPSLARLIGWELDRSEGEITQRNEIDFAPEIYQTLGTIPNLRALVNRKTGWDCRVKEFVHNVFLTNAVEPIRLWEIYEYDSGTGDTRQITRTDGFDGRPQAIIGNSAFSWLFWHGDQNGRREIWCQPLNTENQKPRAVVLDKLHDVPITYSDESPTVLIQEERIWLIWCSNREGNWNIYSLWDDDWAEPFNEFQPNRFSKIDDHPADDHHPTAVINGKGKVSVFWQSNRRGPTDIWMSIYGNQEDGSNQWSKPSRISTAEYKHQEPAAVVDSHHRIWLFYSADLKDRRNLYVMTYQNEVWSDPKQVTDGPYRDEAPAVATFKFWWVEFVILVWHSNRDGNWQIWERYLTWLGWKKPKQLTTEKTADKDPFIVFDHQLNRFRYFWRSQRRGRDYQSRTIDTTKLNELPALHSFQDRSHYTYDTGKGSVNRYARDTVGLYITPDVESEQLIEPKTVSLDRYLQQFLPVQVRTVIIIEPPTYKERLFESRDIDESYFDTYSRTYQETYTGLSESYTDKIPGWIWMRTVNIDDSVHPVTVENLDHITVDFTQVDIDTNYRTWHVGLEQGV